MFSTIFLLLFLTSCGCIQSIDKLPILMTEEEKDALSSHREFIAAVQNGDLAAVKSYVQSGVHFNEICSLEFPYLPCIFEAVKHPAILEYLCKQKADLSKTITVQWTTLGSAMKYSLFGWLVYCMYMQIEKCYPSVDILLEHGAPLSEDLLTSVVCAIGGSDTYLKLIPLVIQAGVSPLCYDEKNVYSEFNVGMFETVYDVTEKQLLIDEYVKAMCIFFKNNTMDVRKDHPYLTCLNYLKTAIGRNNEQLLVSLMCPLRSYELAEYTPELISWACKRKLPHLAEVVKGYNFKRCLLYISQKKFLTDMVFEHIN